MTSTTQADNYVEKNENTVGRNSDLPKDSDTRWEPLKEHDDYEILKEFPFTIRRIRDKYIISESLRNSRGYPFVYLNRQHYSKHILIAKQFLDNPNNFPFVDHINHNTTDYHLENLRWCTASQNNFNRSSSRGVQYEFIDDLPEEAIKVLFYDTRTEHYEFEDNKYYYYHDDENNKDIFYGRINETIYRILYIKTLRGGVKAVSMQDINGNFVALYINRFKHQYTLD